MSYSALAAARETLNVQCYRSAMAPETFRTLCHRSDLKGWWGKPVDIWACFW